MILCTNHLKIFPSPEDFGAFPSTLPHAEICQTDPHLAFIPAEDVRETKGLSSKARHRHGCALPLVQSGFLSGISLSSQYCPGLLPGLLYPSHRPAFASLSSGSCSRLRGGKSRQAQASPSPSLTRAGKAEAGTSHLSRARGTPRNSSPSPCRRDCSSRSAG